MAALIGATVEKSLDATLWRLITSEIGLQDLTPALAGFYSIGFEHGRQSVLPELECATEQRDSYYERWANPGTQLADVRLRHMRAAAEEYWEEFVATQAATQTESEGRND